MVWSRSVIVLSVVPWFRTSDHMARLGWRSDVSGGQAQVMVRVRL